VGVGRQQLRPARQSDGPELQPGSRPRPESGSRRSDQDHSPGRRDGRYRPAGFTPSPSTRAAVSGPGGSMPTDSSATQAR
jgi:hypothetical protein